ncbi:PPPDE putative peptidase domain-containing protein [Crepidotus variabilis]|uniref:PPPDE putative peptidase domain-containing protein n=1 Tax=Crepidotus variabilis TaxID=179855 RepID=A0A9P6E9N6_9AGAR|nr:PPPDE putative peptidase domain-containing protein [Crepidotus variabilis]
MSSVKLYVYDLTNGMAKQLSMQLTGKQIDGIWHTSVVVFGKEIFYGQGILMTQPGRSHHGQPLQVIDMGETALDQDTFNDYLAEMRTHYTADKYHLLDFNCNSFTDDCIGFLTGNSIPSFVKDLPTDFLSTPFGDALRPTIDAMFRRPTPGAVPLAPAAGSSSSPDPQLTASILQSATSQAEAGTSVNTGQPSSSITAPIHMITNSATFNNFVRNNKAAVALFTAPKTCPPCRMIEPVYERLAEEKGSHGGKQGAAFATIDTDAGVSRALSAEWGIRATPTFIFFLNGKKIDELKGANQTELRSQVDLLLFQAFPPHPHTSLSLPSVQALSLNPILFTQVPAFDAVLSKQIGFIDTQESWPSSGPTKDQVKVTISGDVMAYLKARYPSSGTADSKAKLPSAETDVLTSWTQATAIMSLALPIESLFPIADLWRLAFLDPAVCTWSATLTPNSPPSFDVINTLLPKAILALDSPAKGARNYILIVLRLLCNMFSNLTLAHKIIRAHTLRDQLTVLLIPSLLHNDAMVRTASASLAFNVAAVLQKDRVDGVRSGGIQLDNEEDLADWEVEVVTAVIEAVDREKESEEVVHRLVASLAFFLRLAPFYESHAKPLLEVLQSRQTLRSKLSGGEGWKVENGIQKKDIRKLVEEVADKLCA